VLAPRALKTNEINLRHNPKHMSLTGIRLKADRPRHARLPELLGKGEEQQD
jgi:hypothetical protein